MNKKILSLSLIAALAFGASSCGKKSSNEPIKPNPVAPSPGNNGGGNTAGGTSNGSTTGGNNGSGTNAGNTNSGNAQESNASVTLTVPAGKSVIINGTTYTGNSQNKIFLDDSFKKLEISGNDLPSLEISGDNLTEVKIKEEMAKLTELKIVSKERDANKTLALDLSGLTNVTSLTLAGYNFGTVNLSKMVNLKKLLLGQRNPEKDTSFAKVIWPTDNKIQDLQTRAALTNEAVDLNNLPNLLRAILVSPYFDKISFANSSKLQVVAVSNPTGAKSFDLELENHSTLKDITLNGVHVKKLVVTNAPNLSPQGKNQPLNFQGVTVDELKLTKVNKDGVVQILKSINKDGLKKAVLPGYDFTLGTAPLDGFSHLNQSNVTL
jgi:lipoprotein